MSNHQKIKKKQKTSRIMREIEDFAMQHNYSSPECHTSVSCESSWLSCHLANIPNSNSLHTYWLCSSLEPLGRRSQEHLHVTNMSLWNTMQTKSSFQPSCSILTDEEVRAAGAQTGAPLSCLNIRPITAWTWLVGDDRVRHFRHPDLRLSLWEQIQQLETPVRSCAWLI